MGVSSVKDSDIAAAATMDNLDRAALHIQKIAGITEGDIAGISLNGSPCGRSNPPGARHRGPARGALHRRRGDRIETLFAAGIQLAHATIGHREPS
jgi:hypothetical protein